MSGGEDIQLQNPANLFISFVTFLILLMFMQEEAQNMPFLPTSLGLCGGSKEVMDVKMLFKV